MTTPAFPAPPSSTAPDVAGGKDPDLIPGVIPGLPLVSDPDPWAAEDAPAEPGRGTGSALEALLAEVVKEVAADVVWWTVPTRPSISVGFRTDISDADMKIAQKAARVKGKTAPDGTPELDQLKLAQVLLGRYNVGIAYAGLGQARDDRGEPATFRSPEIWASVGARSAAECVAKLYATDGAQIAHGRALSNASGWLDDPEDAEAGPTLG